ncbi:G-protein coupled receptor [Biomphalaria glabrata]|nr:putative G-protein coupled receptor [Biomphalaria glabrata]
MDEVNLTFKSKHFIQLETMYAFSPVLTNDTFCREFHWTMSVVVIPLLSLVGMVGNIITIVMLCQGKCNKSSTLLILALALADSVLLFGINNIVLNMHLHGQVVLSETLATFAYCCYMAQLLLEVIGKVSSMLLPVVITLDRIVAVLSPFRYSTILTPNRTLLIICCVFLFSVLDFSLLVSKFTFLYDNSTGFGLTSYSLFYNNHRDLYEHLIAIPVFLFGPVSVLPTLIGCVVIGIKIYMQEKSRMSLIAGSSKCKTKNLFHRLCLFIKETCNRLNWSLREVGLYKKQRNHGFMITSPESAKEIEISHLNEKLEERKTHFSVATSSIHKGSNPCIGHSTLTENPRDVTIHATSVSSQLKTKRVRQRQTTKTLLSVCVVYCIANTFNFLVIQYLHEPTVSARMALIFEEARKTALVVNSICNFLFYVGFNRVYRERYRKMFAYCSHKARKK